MKPNIPSLKPRIATIDTRQGSSAAVQRIRGYELTKIRERILLRDGYACRRCGRVSTTELVVDHVTPSMPEAIIQTQIYKAFVRRVIRRNLIQKKAEGNES